MRSGTRSPLRIAIVGAGFSGTVVAAELHRLTDEPIEIFLFDKTGYFGTGAAYSTPYVYHLLNVRAKDMSAFEDKPMDFVDWLNQSGNANAYLEANGNPIDDQFVPRAVYGLYLKDLLNDIQTDNAGKTTLKLMHEEVIDIQIETASKAKLLLKNSGTMEVDKIVLALGNGLPSVFPFPVSPDTRCIINPWHYTELEKIDSQDPVLIVGTGLSMIDAVLTLHDKKHQGMIYAVSRHGLLPLPHSDKDKPITLDDATLPKSLRELSMHLRETIESHVEAGGDWREVINALRLRLPTLWQGATLKDKKRFLRHIMPYWNIHRHRVHHQLNNLLTTLSEQGQLKILSGRVMSVSNDSATIRIRHENTLTKVQVKWLINCLGPGMNIASAHKPLAESLVERGYAVLDPLHLGFEVTADCALQDKSGLPSSFLYSVGPPTKGTFWESVAVPEIRKHSFKLARSLLNGN